jgi:hypothetical protein
MQTRNKTYNNISTDEIIHNTNNNISVVGNNTTIDNDTTNDNDTTIDNDIRTYNNIRYMCNIFVNIINYLFVVTNLYIMWIILHYIASHLYVYLCVPKNIWGFIISPFMSATPQCQALRWLIYNGANMINNMWIVLGTWLSGLLLSTPKLANAS